MEITYQVDTRDTNSHLIRIRGEFTTSWSNPILEMPVWTPGSYKIRDYSKHVQDFLVETQGQSLEWVKISKNQWQVKVSKGSKLVFSYAVYGFEFSVRTTYLVDNYGLLTPASLFFYAIKEKKNTKGWKYRLRFTIPKDWHLFTSLKKDGEEYTAQDFDELVDSPIALADPSACESSTYEIDNGQGKPVSCKIALIGIKGNQDIEEFRDGMIKLQETSIDMFGELPYDRYLWVLFVVGSGRGGLEHKYSNFSIIPRWHFKGDEKNFAKLMSLEAHEHFHTYNIKRIRPQKLGPFDYTQEVYTTSLWVAEGLTSYYDNLFLPRSGLIDEKQYWKIIANDIKQLHSVHGRKKVSLSEASFDAWIKLYQRHEGTMNSYVSYYLKGSLVGLMLDLEIRKQTKWKYSLDTFFTGMYQEYKRNPQMGYQENEFQQLVEKHTNTDLERFWERYIDGVEELEIDHYLNMIGMELISETNNHPYLGWELNSTKRKVTRVHANSPAMKGGIYAKDEIVAINEYKVTTKTYDTLLSNLIPNEKTTIHLFRDRVLREKIIIGGDPKPTKYRIEPMDDATEEQTMRRMQLLQLSQEE